MFQHRTLARVLVPLRPAFLAVGLRPTAGYEQVKAGTFPAPIKDGRRSLVPSDELDEVIAARIAGQSEQQIRALVQRLHEQRTTAVRA